jgi:hypothetical protein
MVVRVAEGPLPEEYVSFGKDREGHIILKDNLYVTNFIFGHHRHQSVEEIMGGIRHQEGECQDSLSLLHCAYTTAQGTKPHGSGHIFWQGERGAYMRMEGRKNQESYLPIPIVNGQNQHH